MYDQATYYLILEEVPCYFAKNIPATLQQEFDLYYEEKKFSLPSTDVYQWWNGSSEDDHKKFYV